VLLALLLGKDVSIVVRQVTMPTTVQRKPHRKAQGRPTLMVRGRINSSKITMGTRTSRLIEDNRTMHVGE